MRRLGMWCPRTCCCPCASLPGSSASPISWWSSTWQPPTRCSLLTLPSACPACLGKSRWGGSNVLIHPGFYRYNLVPGAISVHGHLLESSNGASASHPSWHCPLKPSSSRQAGKCCRWTALDTFASKQPHQNHPHCNQFKYSLGMH